MILLRGVIALGNFFDIESEFGAEVIGRCFFVGDGAAVFLPQLRVQEGLG
jgi:hypothetical protein